MDKNAYHSRLKDSILYHESGKVTRSLGMIYEAHLPGASVGSQCVIQTKVKGVIQAEYTAEVIGFKGSSTMLMAHHDMPGVNTESLVILKELISTVRVGDSFLGRVIDAQGNPIDGKGPIVVSRGEEHRRSLYEKPSHPLERMMINSHLDLGVKAIDGLLSCGKGQRVGIMAGSGVGKSVLLGMMARNTSANVNVIALIGERGREVREFIERDLGEEGLKRSVVVVATSDSSPLLRMRGAFLAATIAEYFRDQSQDVLFLMDSVTRFCMAQREIGLSLGEPPASKGYTPSVFSTLPKLLERAGTSPKKGSITGLFTVLVEGDDLDDPIADAARSILDGHIVLTRELAERNHFPAIDVLKSTSRVMNSVVSEQHQAWARQIREWLAVYRNAEDLINIGAYVRGASVKIDQAISVIERINDFLRQTVNQKISFQDTLSLMHSIIRSAEAHADAHKQAPDKNAVAQPQIRF